MANKRWQPRALARPQLDTLTIGGTWAAGETLTCTINTKALVLTIGATVTTTQIATELASAWNNDDGTALGTDYEASIRGPEIPEFDEITAEASGSTVLFTKDGETTDSAERSKPFTLTVAEGSTSGTVSNVTTTAATGPHHWDNINNWDTGAVPVSGVNEVQTVTVDATSGNWKIAFNGSPMSAAIAFDAAASAVQSAIEALSTVGAGNVSVTGGPGAAGGGTPYTITFQNDLGHQNVAEVTTDNDTLAGGASTATPATTQAGSTGDDVYLDNSDVSILYALDQAAVALNSLNIAFTYTGNIGLPKLNEDSDPYEEYREDYLKIGATTINVAGTGTLKINTGTLMTTLNVQGASDLTWKGTNAYNELYARGQYEVRVVPYGGEIATLSRLDSSGSGTIDAGAGLTLTTLENNGAALSLSGGATTITQLGGTTTVEAGAVTTLNLRGGTCVYNSAGTLGTATVGGDGQLDFSSDPRTKTVTNPIDIYGTESRIEDPEGSVSNLRVDFYEGALPEQVSWGTQFRLTRSAVA